MSRYTFSITFDVEGPDIDLEVFKKVLGKTLEKNPRFHVAAVGGHQVKQPGPPAQVTDEIKGYLPGRKKRSAKQIARAIQRTPNSLYKPLRELEEAGLVVKSKHPTYGMAQWAWVGKEETGATD